MERRFVPVQSAPVRVETREDGSRFIVGYASVFFSASDPGTEYELWPGIKERIMPGAFDRAAREDDVRGLFNHEADNLLGRTTARTLTLSVDGRGLKYEIAYDEKDPDHVRVMRKIDRGDLTGSSFAFSIDSEVWKKDGDSEIREINAVTLYDVGPVTYPAYEATTAGARAENGFDDAKASHEQWKKAESERSASISDIQRRARLAELDCET